VMQNEFSKELVTAKGFSFDNVELLTPDHLSLELLDEVELKLNQLFEYYKDNYNQVWLEKDVKKTEVSDTPEKRAAFVALEDSYSNESLREFVTNENELEKIVEYKGHLVQKSFPIYLTPNHKGFFKAHFYAPSKQFFGRQISTKSANLMVIWGMTTFMIILILFDGLKLFIDALSIGIEWISKLFRLRSKPEFT
jgi:ABC transport system ATP-binding/permease protein